jgi:hypothetical protein
MFEAKHGDGQHHTYTGHHYDATGHRLPTPPPQQAAAAPPAQARGYAGPAPAPAPFPLPELPPARYTPSSVGSARSGGSGGSGLRGVGLADAPPDWRQATNMAHPAERARFCTAYLSGGTLRPAVGGNVPGATSSVELRMLGDVIRPGWWPSGGPTAAPGSAAPVRTRQAQFHLDPPPSAGYSTRSVVPSAFRDQPPAPPAVLASASPGALYETGGHHGRWAPPTPPQRLATPPPDTAPVPLPPPPSRTFTPRRPLPARAASRD